MNHPFDKIVNKIEETTIETLQSLGETFQDVEEATAVSLRKSVIGTPEQKAYVVGKTAQEQVQTPEGEMIVGKGEIITPSEVEKAQQHSILMDIYRVSEPS